MGKHRALAIAVLMGVLFLGWGFFNRVEIKQQINLWRQKKNLPPAVEVKVATKQANVEKSKEVLLPASAKLPTEINLAVPFISQAPYEVWDAVHKEACEEAAAIMLAGFFQGQKKIEKETAELELQKLVEWEKQKFGYFEDTTALEVAIIMREYFGLPNARAISISSIEDVKKELAAERPVIVPVAGRLLKNPYYRQPGPLYHMLVIKGYTKDGFFITNDPGTRRGADFTYKFEVLYKAIHDWRADGDILKGRKVMIIIE